MEKSLEKYKAALALNFPGLSLSNVEYLSEGWDSVALLVNDDLIFRFPKRPEVERNLLVEIGLLPELAPLLSIPIPNFTYISKQQNTTFPFVFVGYSIIRGESLDEWPASLQAAHWWRPALGDFLTALHSFPVERASQLGVRLQFSTGLRLSSNFDNWHEALEDFYRVARERVFYLLSDTAQDQAMDKFEDFLDDPQNFQFEPTLLHADLLYNHILLDTTAQKITGIIDFGDVSIGDPACDVPPEIVAFYKRPLGPNYAQRRAFYHWVRNFVPVIFGCEYHDPALIEFGLNALQN